MRKLTAGHLTSSQIKTPIRIMCGVHQEMTVKAKDKGILISKITGAEINSQYMKEYKPLMDKRSRFIFAVHEEA